MIWIKPTTQRHTLMTYLLLIVAFLGSPLPVQTQHDDLDIKPALVQIELTLSSYRTWLTSYEVTNVVKGTNHAARATILIDSYLADYATAEPSKGEPVGIRGIRSLLLKQMRIHLDLLSTNVPAGIVNYESNVIDSLEEQLNLLENTLHEFERHESGS